MPHGRPNDGELNSPSTFHSDPSRTLLPHENSIPPPLWQLPATKACLDHLRLLVASEIATS